MKQTTICPFCNQHLPKKQEMCSCGAYRVDDYRKIIYHIQGQTKECQCGLEKCEHFNEVDALNYLMEVK